MIATSERAGQFESPLHPLPRIGSRLGIDLWVKRDDLCPIPGGGSKVRKLLGILRRPPARVDAIVTSGGTQSNHARTAALVAAARGLRCDLVLHGDRRELEDPKGNLLLMLLAGAHIRIVAAHEIGPTLERVLEELRASGYSPLLVEGGGHSVAGSLAMADAALEFASQRSDPQWIPEFIVHASGTGGTQAGLLVGLDLLGWPTRVIGVSVARAADRGGAVVRDLYLQLREEVQKRFQLEPVLRPVEFRDEWVGEGYAKPLPGVAKLIGELCKLEGLVLDPTYTAKAMAGLIDLVRQGAIQKGSRVLFWHTGGLLNMLAANLEWGVAS